MFGGEDMNYQIEQPMDLMQKLAILADAAKYDVACTSSGVDRSNDGTGIGNCLKAGICHTFAGDGRCISVSYTHLDVYKRQIKGCIQPESQCPAWTGGTHVGTKDDDIIKTRSRIQSGSTKDHTFYADKDQNAYCDKSKQNSPDARRKLCKKVNME